MTTRNLPAQVPGSPTGSMINRLLAGELELPEDITRVIDVQGWARSLIAREPYTEPDPEYLQRMLLLQTLSAANIDEIFAQGAIKKLQEAIPNVPGAGTGPIEIYNLYVTDSDFGEGAPTYLILGTRSLVHGTEIRYTTGATQIQAQVMAALCLGEWPLRCAITRTDRKDKGGRYMFWLIPPDDSQASF
jgi:hypothetical protein